MIDARYENVAERSPRRAVAHSLADLAHDASVLFELQSKLFKLELERAGQKVVPPIVMFVLAAVLALASVPLLLVCFAFVLVEFAGLSQWLSFLLAAVLGMVLAAAMGAGGYFAITRMGWPFPLSQAELQRNLEWFRGSMRPGAMPTETRATY